MQQIEREIEKDATTERQSCSNERNLEKERQIENRCSNTGWRRRSIGCLILRCQFSQKSPIISGFFWKMTCNLRHPMGLRHPVDRNRFSNNVKNRNRCSNRKKYDVAIESVRMHKIDVREGRGGEWGARRKGRECAKCMCISMHDTLRRHARAI